MFDTTNFQMLEGEEMLKIDGGIPILYPTGPILPGYTVLRWIINHFK